jgi:hypothetical protein|nr:MAG TPA: hypothetical protein [Caudoviricetes sp.]DAU86056.1 MAG TPA: hypothetical protein [Caudoviricetes sp.]
MITLREIVNSVVIKRSVLADSLDKILEENTGYSPRLAIMEYRDAYYKTDTLAAYTFRINDLAKFTDDPDKLNQMVKDNRFIYTYLDEVAQEELLNKKRQEVLTEYFEYNEYYRILMGLPRLKVKGNTLVEDPAYFVYLDSNVILQGVDNRVPIHMMTDLQKRTLVSSGEMAKLILKYPNLEYLKYVGKGISALDCRDAKEYEIIYVDTSTSNMRMFVDHYRQVRNNFMVNYYDEVSSVRYTFYEPLQCVNLIMAAMANVNAYIPRNQLDSETIDESEIYNLFESYGVPKFNFSLEYLQKIAQKLNTFMRKKGSKAVINEISKSFNEITIFKYFLWKRINPNVTDMTLSPKEKYELFYVKAPIMADDPYEYVKDPENLVPFRDIADADEKWGEDGNNLEDEIKAMDFSYSEGKYLSLNNKIDLASFTFEMSFFVRYVIEHEKPFRNVTIYLDTAGYNATLFEVISYLQCLVFRKMKLRPDIPDTMQSVLYLYGIKYNIDFERLKVLLKQHFKYSEFKKDVNIDNFILMLDGKRYNIGEVLDAFETNLDIVYKLRKLQRRVKTVDDYKIIGDVLKAISYSEKLPETYSHHTDLEHFLGSYTAESVKLINRMDEIKNKATDPNDSSIYNHEISEVINNIRSFINVHKHKRIADLLDTTQTIYSDFDLLNYLEKIIDFFKSYTQDIVSKGLEYSIHDIREGVKSIERLTYIMNLEKWEQVTHEILFTNNDNEKLREIPDPNYLRDVTRSKDILKYIDQKTGNAIVISKSG